MNPLRVEKLVKRFARVHPPALDALSFEVCPEEVFAIVGPSGCGKTTCLRVIAGLERADGGSVWIGDTLVEGPGIHVPPEKRPIGLVFQEYALFPHLDVLHNVSFGLHRLPRKQRRERAMHLLALVGLESMAHRKTHQLSGGQQQRVALARSIAPGPQFILLDEPFSNLDPALRAETRYQLRDVLRETRTTAVLVTHDQEEALSFADRIGVMRDGQLLQIGPPMQVYNQPAGAFVAQFLGRTNLVAASAQGCQAATAMGSLCLNCSANGKVLLSVRPEHLRLVEPRPGQPVGRIISREFKGHDLTLMVCFGDRQIVVHTDYTCPYQVGQSVSVVHAEPAVVVNPDM